MSERLHHQGIAAWAALILFACAGGLCVVSISGTGDTPCGSLIAPNFGWHLDNQCGLVHWGTLVIVLTMAVGGLLVVVSTLATEPMAGRQRASVILGVLAGVALVAVVVLTWRVATYPEPVLRRGWTSLRNVTGLMALTTVVLAGAVRAAFGSLDNENRDDPQR
jgi:hypothetical protein